MNQRYKDVYSQITGGSDQNIVRVTNLNNSGKGSLRNALESQENITIFFDISGIIKLKERLVIKHRKNITIYGETSSNVGIIIICSIAILNSNNIIIRYLRIRNLEEKFSNTIDIRESKNIILENLSISSGTISNINTLNTHNLFIIRSIISHTSQKKSIGATINSIQVITNNIPEITIYSCLFAFTKNNIPNVSGLISYNCVDNVIYDEILNPLEIVPNIEKSIRTYKINNTDEIFWRTSTNVIKYNISTGILQFLSPLSINKDNLLIILNDFLNNVGCSFPKRDIIDNLLINDMMQLTQNSKKISPKTYSVPPQKRKYNSDIHGKSITIKNKYVTLEQLHSTLFPYNI